VGFGSSASVQGSALGHSASASYEGAAIGYAAIGTSSGVGVGAQANGDTYGLALGYFAQGNSNGVAVGYRSLAAGAGRFAIGGASGWDTGRAIANANGAGQLGPGTNTTAALATR
jgi:hypothetical protein